MSNGHRRANTPCFVCVLTHAHPQCTPLHSPSI